MKVQRCQELVVNKVLDNLYFFFHESIKWPVTNDFLNIVTQPVRLDTIIRVRRFEEIYVLVDDTIHYKVLLRILDNLLTSVIIHNNKKDSEVHYDVNLEILNINDYLSCSLFLEPYSLNTKDIRINKDVIIKNINDSSQVRLSWMIPL